MLDLLVILAIIVLVCGTQKLRSIGSDLGAAVKGFKKAVAERPSDPPVGQVKSDRPDAEFPEVAMRRPSGRDSA